MDQLKQQLLEALKHNLFLSETLRTDLVRKLPKLSEAQCQRILGLLQEANANQDDTLREILEREPFFFHRIERTILHTMTAEFNRLSETELKAAEAQLAQDLANYQT